MKTTLTTSSRKSVLFIAWISAVLCGFCVGQPQPAHGANPKPEIIWAIGKPNGTSIEFAPGARDQLTYKIGQSVAARDFAGHHAGSIGFDPAQSGEKPYTIVFDLEQPAAGVCRLVLELIYNSGAPQQIKIIINEQQGIFPVRLAPKEDIDGNEANAMLLAKQRLEIPLNPAWLKSKDNRVTIIPLGIGSMDYDAVILERVEPSNPAWPESLRLLPTMFYRKNQERQVEVCKLVVPFKERFPKTDAIVRINDFEQSVAVTNTGYDFGALEYTVEVPALEKPAKAVISVAINGRAEEATHDFTPSRKWSVFICPKVHNDIGYTDLQPHVNELDTRNTDTVVDILSRFPFYKFNFETAWLVDNYLDCRPDKYCQEFLGWAAKGRAVINAFYLNLMTGICSGEELYRSMYYTHMLHRNCGSNFDFACLTDAPSHSWFLPTLLTDVGIKAFSNGSNQTRAPILNFSNLNEDSPFYWEGMNGERIMMWFARSYTQLKRLTGPDFVSMVSNYEYLKTSVPQFLVRYIRPDYAFDAVMIYGAYVDNAAIPEDGEAPLIEQWNREYEFPKLIVATDADYFNYIEKHFKDKLPVYRGDCGAYWEDGVASTAQATSLNRQSQKMLPVAETTASVATLFEPRFKYPAEDFRDAWRNVMFYDEHTWGAFNSISQPDKEFVKRQWEIKESYSTRANLDARNLIARACNRLCQQFAVQGDTVFAFNWQNTARTAPLEIELDNGRYLVDLSNEQPVPMDVIFDKDGFRRIRFLARNVPPMGYKGYAIRGLDSPPAELSDTKKLSGDTIESRYYRLTIEAKTGAIKSLYDKEAKKELADSESPYKLNEYIYVSGGENSLILNNTFGTAPAELTIHVAEGAEVVEHLITRLGQRLVVTAKAKNAPKIITEYIVYDDLKRVEIINTVHKDETRKKEAVYFAFPFGARNPDLSYQIQNGWVRPNADQLPGACREWFAAQNLVKIQDDEFVIAWSTPDAPLFTLTDINRGKWLRHLDIKNGHVYSYTMHNYWFTNYKATQGGILQFRYFITSGDNLTPDRLALFDADTRSPVIAYPFLSTFSARLAQAERPLPPAGNSFMSCNDPNLQVVCLKAAEDGDGFILRLKEVAGNSGEAEVKLPMFNLEAVYLCNGVEVNTQQLPTTGNSFKVTYNPNRFVTVRLMASSALSSK